MFAYHPTSFLLTFSLLSILNSLSLLLTASLLSLPSHPPLSLLPFQTNTQNASAFLKYWRSMYFALSTLTGAGRTIAPETDSERVFQITSLLLGIFVVAYLIGNVTSIISNLDVLATEFQKQKRFVVDYLKFRQVPDHLVERAKNVYDLHWAQNKGAESNKALSKLPRYGLFLSLSLFLSPSLLLSFSPLLCFSLYLSLCFPSQPLFHPSRHLP